MRRRDLIAMLGSAALAAPRPAGAQVNPPLIASLTGTVAHKETEAAFSSGLQETGFVDGRNVRIERRWAEGHFDRLPALGEELARLHPDLFVTGGGATPAAVSAVAGNRPIVSMFGTDPVEDRFVASFNRPGGNVTGFFLTSWSLEPKKLELLHKMVPQTHLVAVLFHSGNAALQARSDELRAAAQKLGLDLVILIAREAADFDRAFATIQQSKAGALLVTGDPVLNNARVELVALAARHAVPAIYEFRETAEAGGLMSYGDSLSAGYRQLGLYAGQILKGAKPADLPVVQSQTFEFVINLKTAKALGLAVPPNLLALADAVIE